MPRGAADRRGRVAASIANPPSLALVDGPSVSDVFSDPAHPKTSSIHSSQPVAFLPFGRTLMHAPGARNRKNRESPPQELCPSEDSDLPLYDSFVSIESPSRSDPELSRARRKRLRQHERWTQEVIPRLIDNFLEVLHISESLRNPLLFPAHPQCTCQVNPISLDVVCVSFSGLRKLSLNICSCKTAPLQLLQHGFFGCAPCFPTLAADLNVLDFCLELFARIPPNKTAFCHALEAFLKTRGFLFEFSDSIRKRFNKCLYWFQALKDATRARLESTIYPTISALHDASEQAIDSRPSTPTPSSPGPRRGEMLCSDGVVTINETDDTPASSPSAYLRSCCPACFGNPKWQHDLYSPMDFHVCIDACFQQKRGLTDDGPPYVHPNSAFLSPEETRSEEEEVSRRRPNRSKRNADGEVLTRVVSSENSAQKAPDEVLDDCEASFKAADERRQKASTKFFSDTGLMALLCRHDRVLWLANMTSAGEKQHYALALLRKLFRHLPADAVVGVLYDVGCQLHRSISKWGLLSQYADRMVFAISVFHAFGHQWPCQLVYHPRKCDGFGLTDGEGCERFWSSIKRLIPTLQISGYYERLRILDTQIQYSSTNGLAKLGTWLLRRTRDCYERLYEAERVLREISLSDDDLMCEWEAQVAYQTKSLARRSKNTGKTLVERVVELEKRCEAIRRRVRNLQNGIETNEELDIGAQEESIRDLERAHNRLVAERREKLKDLGLQDCARVESLRNSSFVNDRMNARALHARLLSKLRNRRFELQYLERPYQSHRSSTEERKKTELVQSQLDRREPGIIQLAKKYNTLCARMSENVPDGFTCPEPIPIRNLFDLDIDSVVWREDGLYNSEHEDISRWMCDDDVRKGILALLDRDQCREELRRLKKENAALQSWLQHSWSLATDALVSASGNSALEYAIQLHRQFLITLCIEWQDALSSVAFDSATLSHDWGPSAKDVENFKVMVEAHTFRATPPSRFSFRPASQELEGTEQHDVDLDEETYADADHAEDGEVLELAEQIEADNSRALMIAFEGSELDSQSALLNNVVYTPIC